MPANSFGRSKRSSNEAADEKKPEAYPLGYVEDFFEVRTKLGAFFNILVYTENSAHKNV